MIRRRSNDFDGWLAGGQGRDVDLAGEQVQPRHGVGVFAVIGIAQQRAAQMLGVDPDLVGAAGTGPPLHPGEIIEAAQDFPVGDGLLTGGVDFDAPALTTG